MLSTKDVRAAASSAAFGRKLITNSLRGLVAEVLIAAVLEPEWTWCAADWAGWDFECSGGLKLEVKQSAARQTWTPIGSVPSKCRFDIAPRTGAHVGRNLHPRIGRQADVYIFAHHFEAGDHADHCDPRQWMFYVVQERLLGPHTKSIGLTAVKRLANGCRIDDLKASMDCCEKILMDKVNDQPDERTSLPIRRHSASRLR